MTWMKPLLLAAIAIVALVPSAVAQNALPPAAERIGRLDIIPRDLTMAAGDTMRIRAEVFDRQGNAISDARLEFQAIGAYFEAVVERDGLVRSGSTGTVPVGMLVFIPGSEPLPVRLDVRMVPGPATRVEIVPGDVRLVVGQRVNLDARSFSEHGDPRSDDFTWASSAPRIASVDPQGRVHALAPGATTISARVGDVFAEVRVEVVRNDIASIEIAPAVAQARQGDVIRFEVIARDSRGRVIEGLMPSFSFSPGNGVIDPDGGFVGYLPGEYAVTASFGDRTAEAQVTLQTRDVRRPLTVVGRLPRTQFSTEEVWVHPTQPVVYLGTGQRRSDVRHRRE